MSADFLTRLARNAEQAAREKPSVPEVAEAGAEETPASQPIAGDDSPAPSAADLEKSILEKLRAQSASTPVTPSIDEGQAGRSLPSPSERGQVKGRRRERGRSRGHQGSAGHGWVCGGQLPLDAGTVVRRSCRQETLRGQREEPRSSSRLSWTIRRNRSTPPLPRSSRNTARKSPTSTKALMVRMINDPSIETPDVATAYARGDSRHVSLEEEAKVIGCPAARLSLRSMIEQASPPLQGNPRLSKRP